LQLSELGLIPLCKCPEIIGSKQAIAFEYYLLDCGYGLSKVKLIHVRVSFCCQLVDLIYRFIVQLCL
jgi:hypothetical protein